MGKVVVPKGFRPKFTKHWYLVANRAEAVIYEGTPGEGLHYLKRFHNPKGKLTELQLVSDRPGRSFSRSIGSRVRHAFVPHSFYHEQVAIQFSRRIAKALEQSALKGEFSDLVILAEPHFLGLLNKAASKGMKAKIRQEVPHEWGEGSDRDLEAYLQKKVKLSLP